ncbi:hypothetical protein [Longitalea luteola]|uniref:hypothetical protein n=1 Tax=Longitalea luteola TaxID=2812563 RepID=UPI001A958A14|nr:hypothetical protein [Longitalea luteola]
MKRYNKTALFVLVAIFTVLSCKKKDYSLSGTPDKSTINMEVKQDLTVDDGGNTVYLINHSDKVEPYWDYATGSSTRRIDTVRYAFKGDYVIKRTAVTSGGLVELDPVTIHVTKDNLNYVSDPLWILLTGGPGNEKTWLLDANKNGDQKFFTSPAYFAGQNNVASTKAPDGQSIIWPQCSDVSDPLCWKYEPNYLNDTWVAEKIDYGFMTFSLKGGPYLNTDHKGVAGVNTESGTYYFDINTLTITTSNATVLGVAFTPADAANLLSVKVLTLTENTMQLAVKHKTKPEYQVLNYISKQYSDNWVPPPPAVKKPDDGFNPVFAPGELRNILTGGAGAPGRFWVIDANGNPIDWVAKGNGWTVNKNSTYDWGWNETWDAAVKDAWIRFDNSGGYTRFQNGTMSTGTFTIDETRNEIKLVGNVLLQNPGHGLSPAATTIKVVKGWPSDYRTKGIWLGTSYDAAKDEWFAFHYITP